MNALQIIYNTYYITEWYDIYMYYLHDYKSTIGGLKNARIWM